MKAFMDRDFLLENETARTLFHKYAENQPIYDYHNHLPPREIAERKQYENLTQLWLAADHYKWRAMRACGVDERYITGDAPEYRKFQKWAEVVPQLVGCPLYHWVLPESSVKEEPLYTGEVSDNTQTVISEDENGSTVDLSGSVTKEEAQETKPTDKPVPIGDTTNKDEVPSYPEEVPVTAPEVQVPADNSESSHPGQVYDPVFGWIDTGNTTYDVVDSDGDINKQIGTMGE